MCCFLIFFFKHKTAYELRISDGSSDVCSSDLLGIDHPALLPDGREVPQECAPLGELGHAAEEGELPLVMEGAQPGEEQPAEQGAEHADRSEEHTSELQSLMRISYAVFCLKKKTHENHKIE